MGNKESTPVGEKTSPSSSKATSTSEGRSFGGTSFLEEAGAASLFRCGNTENVLFSNANSSVKSDGAAVKSCRISMENICAQQHGVLDGAVRWRNGGESCRDGILPCTGQGSSSNNADLSDPEDEFQSLHEIKQQEDSAAAKIFARSLVKELSDPNNLTMKDMVQREKMLLMHEQQLIDGSKAPNVYGGVISTNASIKSISSSHSHSAPSKHRVAIGLCLSRYHPTLGHPKSVTRQTAFDFNELQDRDYKYVSSTDKQGWRAGGGEPGTAKTYDDDLNSALSYTSPNSPGGHSMTSHVKDTTGGGSKIPSPDTVHIPIIEIDAQSEAHVQLIIHALAKGEIFIPHMSIMPEALGVIGASTPDLVVRFGCERNEDFPIEEWPNWCLEFMHNQLFDYFQPLGAIWNKRPFQITLARKVKWKTVKHMNNYFSRCEMVINAWREKGPQYLDPELSHFDGGASPEEIARAHGIYLTRNGAPTNYFAPNFEPPYTTKMTRSLLANVINKSWDKAKRDWASEPPGKLSSTNAVLSRLFGCADPTVLTTHADKSIMFTAMPPEQRERRREKQITNGDPVEQSASTSEETNYSAKSKASSKSLLDDCMQDDSPDKNVEQPEQQFEDTSGTVRTSLMDQDFLLEPGKHIAGNNSDAFLNSDNGFLETPDISLWKDISYNTGEETSTDITAAKDFDKAFAAAKFDPFAVGKGLSPSDGKNEQIVHNLSSKDARLNRTFSVAGSVVSSRFDDADEYSASKNNRAKAAPSLVGSIAASSRFDDAEDVSVSHENRGKKASSTFGIVISSASQKPSTSQLGETDKAAATIKDIVRKESEAESFSSWGQGSRRKASSIVSSFSSATQKQSISQISEAAEAATNNDNLSRKESEAESFSSWGRGNRGRKASSIVGSFSSATQKPSNSQKSEAPEAATNNDNLSRKESEAESFSSRGHGNRGRKASSTLNSLTAAQKSLSSQMSEAAEDATNNDILTRKQSEAESLGSRGRPKSASNIGDTKGTIISKENSSKRSSSVASSTVSKVTQKASSEVTMSKEIPLHKLSFGEDNSAALVIQKNPSDEVKEKAAASKSQPMKGSVVTANDISSALLKSATVLAPAEETSVHKDSASNTESSTRISSTSNSSRIKAGFAKTLKGKLKSNVKKSQLEFEEDFGFPSMKLESSFVDQSTDVDGNQNSDNNNSTPLKGIDDTSFTSLDATKSTPLIDNKKRSSSRFSKIRQERLVWTAKHNELAEKKDFASLEAKLNSINSVSDKPIKTIKDLTSSHGKENSMKFDKQSKPINSKVMYASPESPQNSLAYSVDESTFDPFGNFPLEDTVGKNENKFTRIENAKQDKHNRSILRTVSSASTLMDPIPSDEELFAIGWAKALDPKTGYYYYFTLDRSKTVWENPLATTTL